MLAFSDRSGLLALSELGANSSSAHLTNKGKSLTAHLRPRTSRVTPAVGYECKSLRRDEISGGFKSTISHVDLLEDTQSVMHMNA